MHPLKDMRPGQVYTLPVNGKTIQGPKETFLRRRSSDEILDSGLSSGCGDYAFVFGSLMDQRGYQTLLVDGAALSTRSLVSQFAGHAVVAIRSGNDSDWLLVDPTNGKVLSDRWLCTTMSFQSSGRTTWIGYCGPFAQYPVHNAVSLQAFYTKTLRSVPIEVLNTSLLRLTFTVDDSLKGDRDDYVNPYLSDFLNRQPEVFAQYGLSPTREVAVRLICGDDDAISRITQTGSGRWVAAVGRQSGCTDSLLDYFETEIGRSLQS